MPINATVNLQTNFDDNTKTSIMVLNTLNVAYDLLGLSELAKQNITACFTKNTLEWPDSTVLAPYRPIWGPLLVVQKIFSFFEPLCTNSQ